ncbi:MAG: elongation factor G [Acidobacteria bacterium]|nr:elongation factor G [Acidobacteriota bacterium]
MKAYLGKDIRNVGVVGHGDCGKTSLVAALLQAAGITQRLGRVDDGTTITDFDEEEHERKVTISTALAYVEWATPLGTSSNTLPNKAKINLLDTPGYNIFINDTLATLIAADAAFVVVDGGHGVEIQTEKVWDFCDRYELPRAVVINRLDRERASFERAVESVQSVFGRNAVPVQLPIGAEKDFKGVVDLVAMKAWTYSAANNGKGTAGDIPPDMKSAAEEAHSKLVELIAEGNDALMEQFFDKGTLEIAQLTQGLRDAVVSRRLFPVLCSAATAMTGADQLLNFAVDYFPSPLDRGAAKGRTADGKEVERKIADNTPVSAFVFKTSADVFAGRITYFKVMSGVIANDANLTNFNKAGAERLAHISIMQGKTATAVPELHAGDIGTVAKLKDTHTGDTLGDKLPDKTAAILYPPVAMPEPSISFAIAPNTRNDEDHLSGALHRILEEDLSLRFYRDAQTKEFLLGGSGQQHIEVIVSKLKKRYHVNVTLKAPKVPYRETITGKADVQGKHKKQSGGHGQFGDCKIKMEPLPRGGNFEFVNDTFGGSIPKNYIPAVEKGIVDSAARGYLAGFPVVDFKVIVYDGSYHDVDSSEMAFKIAGSMAFKKAMEVAKPVLLEPVMHVEVYAPDQYSGDLIGDMNGRRGRIQGMETRGHSQVLKAQAPMSEMLTYASQLTAMTQGRGTFHMEFSHYDIVPAQIAGKIVEAYKASRAGEEVEVEV